MYSNHRRRILSHTRNSALVSRENRRPFERVEAIKTPLTFSTPLIVYCQLVPPLGIVIVDLVEKRLVSYIAGIAARQLLPFIRSNAERRVEAEVLIEA